MITICTMVKNEDDIVEKWIEYHGEIFGYKNLIIIDNYSTDNTYNICRKYVQNGIILVRKDNYLLKGEYMTFYKNTIKSDIFIPLDIDEFICYYDKNNNTVSKKRDIIINYLMSLVKSNLFNGIYKMNYIDPINTNNKRGLQKFTHGIINDYKNHAKTFVIKKYIPNDFVFDHGNHYYTDDYIMSDLYLIHYHARSHYQYVKKCSANITGLNYPINLDILKKMRDNNSCQGHHHINNMVSLLENPSRNFGPALNNNISDKWIYIKDILENNLINNTNNINNWKYIKYLI